MDAYGRVRLNKETPMDAARQLERATRLLDASFKPGSRSQVHRSLDQLFVESKEKVQQRNVDLLYGSAPSQLLQGPQAQQLDRDVASFVLGNLVNLGSAVEAQHEKVTVDPFDAFSTQHERVLLNAVEEATRDCLRGFEARAAEKIYEDWEEAKSRILGSMSPGGLGLSASCALRGNVTATAVSTAPPWDIAIMDTLVSPTFGPAVAQKVRLISLESCARYRDELADCWDIISFALRPSLHEVTCGMLSYLQNRFTEDVKALVYQARDVQLGGMPDAWSLIRSLGMKRFETNSFPILPIHAWYAAYCAARAGLPELLRELPGKAAPCSMRCASFKTICSAMARRLEATSEQTQSMADMPPDSRDEQADAELKNADLVEETNIFRDALLAILFVRNFVVSQLPDATIEDWIWFKLHCVHKAGNETSSAFQQQLTSLQQKTVALPASHFDPTTSVVSVQGGRVADPGNTLNFVKALFLTAQFSRGLAQLRSHDPALHGPALHMAVVLQRAGALKAVADYDPPLSVQGLLCDYAAQFTCSDQLRYLRILEPSERAEALQQMLLWGGAGTNDELLGYIGTDGTHEPGLLESTLRDASGHGTQEESGAGATSGPINFIDLCARAGRSARDHGQYRAALRLLHLGCQYIEVLQTLCRSLCLPIWREPLDPSGEGQLLDGDIRKFVAIYERNIDRYSIPQNLWATTRKLFMVKHFYELLDGGRMEGALDLFDREQLLPLDHVQVLSPQDQEPDELLSEYPRVVSAYVQILHALSSRTADDPTLRERMRRLQAFLAVHSHRITLSPETSAALAGLSLC